MAELHVLSRKSGRPAGHSMAMDIYPAAKRFQANKTTNKNRREMHALVPWWSCGDRDLDRITGQTTTSPPWWAVGRSCSWANIHHRRINLFMRFIKKPNGIRSHHVDNLKQSFSNTIAMNRIHRWPSNRVLGHRQAWWAVVSLLLSQATPVGYSELLPFFFPTN
jgi:hypothetical protein